MSSKQPVRVKVDRDDQPPKEVDVGKQMMRKLFGRFKQSVNRGVDPDAKISGASDLGSVTHDVFRAIERGFKADAADSKEITEDAVSNALAVLKRAHGFDQFISDGPTKGLSQENARLKASSIKISGDSKEGYQVKGNLTGSHELSRLLKQFGFSTDSLPNGVMEVVDDVTRGDLDLSDSKTWGSIATKLASLAFDVPTKVAKTIAPDQTSKLEATGDEPAVVPQAPLASDAFDKTAEVTGAGSINNITNIRSLLLMGAKGQIESSEETAGRIVDEATAMFDVKGLNQTGRGKLVNRLAALLRDGSAIAGSEPSMAKVLDKVTKEIAALNKTADLDSLNETELTPQQITELGTDRIYSKQAQDLQVLGGTLMQIVRNAPAEQRGEIEARFNEVYAGIATLGITTLAAKNLGVSGEDFSDKFDGAYLKILQEVSAIAAGGAVDHPEAVKNAPRNFTLPDAQLTPKQTTDISEYLMKIIGVGVTDPHFKDALQLLGATGADAEVEGGATNIAKWADSLATWLVDNKAIKPEEAVAFKAQIAEAAQAYMPLLQKEQELYKELDALMERNERLKDSPSAQMNLDADIARVEEEIGKLHSGPENEKAHVAIAELFGRAVNTCIGFLALQNGVDLAGKATEAAAAAAAAAGGGGNRDGGGVGGGGGGGGKEPPIGSDPDLNPEYPFEQPDIPPARESDGVGVMGIVGGRRPGDRGGKNQTIHERRAVKCGEILNDPSLSIEDKIFLFMMWFVAFCDEERIQKMKDITEIDERDAKDRKNRDETYSELKSHGTKCKKLHDDRDQAQKDLQHLKDQLDGAETPEKLEAIENAQQHFDNLEAQVNVEEQQLTMLKREYDKLKRKTDSAPKSRDIHFAELKRLDEMRDKVLNMARAVMENSSRNIDKIFR